MNRDRKYLGNCELLLLPDDAKNIKLLMYKLIQNASELYFSTAYLTDWDLKDCNLSNECKQFYFLFGTDFGITRKQAVMSLMEWTPNNLLVNIRAADHVSGFHPKIVFGVFKDNRKFMMLGSSNQTIAGFSKNIEANYYTEISTVEFKKLKEWYFNDFNNALPVSEDWLDTYTERKISKQYKKKVWKITSNPSKLTPGSIKKIDLNGRRKQQLEFLKYSDQIKQLVLQCKNGLITNAQFYENFNTLWSWENGNRFQGRGFEITAKHSNWKSICASLYSIITSNLSGYALDELVREEIDRLAKEDHPARKSWLTEILCHFYPGQFPLDNNPVNKWLKLNKYREPKGSSEGSAYIDKAIKLRDFLKSPQITKLGIKDLAELDTAVWHWAK